MIKRAARRKGFAIAVRESGNAERNKIGLPERGLNLISVGHIFDYEEVG